MNKLVLLLYPFNFRQFDWDRFEIDELKKKSDLVIVDFIDLLYPHFSKAYFKDKKIRKKIIKIDNISKFQDILNNLIKKYNKNILVLNFIKNDTVKSFIINFILKKKELNTISFYNPGISTFDKSITKTDNNFLKKILFLAKRKNETLYKIKGKLLDFFVSFFKIYPSYFFVAGLKCKRKIFNFCKINKIKIVEGHSWDYSLILKEKDKNFFFKNYAVYLDAPGPKFLSDSQMFNEKFPETIKHTYPSLNRFFLYFENKKKLKVIIAPHPKTKIKDRSSLFYHRRVISNNTKNLIQNSKFIITRNSTAVTFAIYYNKPIVLFYTNETINTESQKLSIELANSIGLKALNINELNFINLNQVLKFDKKKYKKYLLDYCTTKKNQIPNFRLITDLLNKKLKV